MINKIEKIGHINCILLITIISITASIILTFIFMKIFNGGMNQAIFATSIIVPAIIAPSVTWYIVGLLIKTHKLEKESKALATYDALLKLLKPFSLLEKVPL